MVETGESSNKPILPYPGRQLISESKEAFFGLKSGIKGRYIYDLGVATGEMLYEGSGGMGISQDKYILELHGLMRMPYAESLIHETFEKYFSNQWGPNKFYRLRSEVNRELKNPSKRTMAKLYCLMACSGFRHNFDKHGNFIAGYFPHFLNTSEIKLKNKKLINSDFIFKFGKFGSIDKNLLTKDSLLYFHMPLSYGKYGHKIFWDRKEKLNVMDYFDFIDSQGLNFLVSSRFFFRGKKDLDLESWSKKYFNIIVPQFKEESRFMSTDIFISNF